MNITFKSPSGMSEKFQMRRERQPGAHFPQSRLIRWAAVAIVSMATLSLAGQANAQTWWAEHQISGVDFDSRRNPQTMPRNYSPWAGRSGNFWDYNLENGGTVGVTSTMSVRLDWNLGMPTTVDPDRICIFIDTLDVLAIAYAPLDQADQLAASAVADDVVGTPSVTTSGNVKQIYVNAVKTRVHVLPNKYKDRMKYLSTVTASAMADAGPTQAGQSVWQILRFTAPLPYVLEVRRVSSNEAYSTLVPAAAGANVQADEEVCDVRLRFLHNDWFGNNINLQPLKQQIRHDLLDYKPRLVRGNGEISHATFIPSETDPDPFPDDTSIYLGKVITSDRDLGTDSFTLQFPADSFWPQQTDNRERDVAQAGINVQWDRYNEWKSGPNGDQPVDSYIHYDEAVPLTFRPKFGSSPAIPITRHTMNFLVTKVTVQERNPITGAFERKTYTSDPSKAVGGVNYKPNLGEYASFSPGQSSDLGGGRYQSSLTIPFNPIKVVENVTLAAEDDQTFMPGQ